MASCAKSFVFWFCWGEEFMNVWMIWYHRHNSTLCRAHSQCLATTRYWFAFMTVSIAYLPFRFKFPYFQLIFLMCWRERWRTYSFGLHFRRFNPPRSAIAFFPHTCQILLLQVVGNLGLANLYRQVKHAPSNSTSSWRRVHMYSSPLMCHRG